MISKNVGPVYEVSIIIVTYHNEQTIEACLTSIVEHVKAPREIIIVDNSEDSQTVEKVLSFAENNPSVKIICQKPASNIGFAKGCNLGAENAGGTFLMFLNPDTFMENDVFERLKTAFEQSDRIGVAGPLMLDKNGRISKTCRNLPTCLNIFLDITGLDRVFGAYRLFRFSHTCEKKVEQVIGACFMVPHAHFIRLDGFDERFFIYFEEVDFCRRSLDKGYAVLFCPEAKIIHLEGISCEHENTAAKMIVQLRRSRDLYFAKHFNPGQVATIHMLNRLEGVAKGVVFGLLFILGKRRTHREKALGFLRVGLWP